MSQSKQWFLQERLIFGLVIIVSLLGIFTWFNINEQEDPFFPYRNGHVLIVAPGMSASAIEDSIIQPLERIFANVDGLERVSSKASDGVAQVHVELQETIYDTEKAWQRVREKVTQAHAQFAHLVTTFELDDRVQDTDSVFLNIRSNKPLIEARKYALYVRDELYKMPDIRKISLIGDPGEQVDVHFSQEKMLELGISPQQVIEQIANANALKNTGTLKGNLYQTNVSSITRLDDIEALKAVEIETADKSITKLSGIAEISFSVPPLEKESFWLNSQRSIGLSIVVPPNELRVTNFGDKLLARLNELNAKHKHYQISPVFFQPAWTESRRNDLALSLLYGSIGVGVVLFLLMSRKVALVVTLTIPAIALSSIAFFGISGGILHQMSIAGLVISLGLMVDNSIVMSELISRYREQGMSNIAASQQAIKDLFKPLATSTFTTIAAFVPMLLSEGNVADFIRMIPVVVIIAIVTSYFYSLALVPAITNNFASFQEGSNAKYFSKLGKLFSQMGTRHPKSAIALFVGLTCLSFLLTSNEGGEFFPKSGRNQAVIDIEGSYGLSHEATLQTVKLIENKLKSLKNVTNIVSFVGNSGPSFYYNLSTSPNEPNVARIVVETHSHEQIPELVNHLNSFFKARLTNTRAWAREIGQGPPIEAPIEIRVLGEDRAAVLAASEAIFSSVSQHQATEDTRRGYVVAKPTLTFDIDEYNLHLAGLKRTDISQYVTWRTIGVTATTIPRERDTLNVVVRENKDVNHANSRYIMNTMIMNNQGNLYPLSSFATPIFKGEAPILTRWKGFNSNTIKSEVSADYNPAFVIEELLPTLQSVEHKYKVQLEIGGVAEEESSSNAALLKTLPIGALLLFAALILQFNSYRVAVIIMITIPLATIGVFPTLSLAGVNFGFMSVLGLLALTGIVVNTAIILIDAVITYVKVEGLPLVNAIEQATKDRFRPVLLTACTTIVGMIPLTSPTSPLWPPMAWTIIGGLVTSTLLTLIILPACLKLCLNEQKLKGGET